MRLLLDTHVLIWALTDSSRLDAPTRGLIEDPDHEVFFSAASIWEIAIKARLGRLDFAYKSAGIAQAARTTGFLEFPIHAGAAAAVETLPPHHRDPFGRLLVAQAITGPVQLLTSDPLLKPYSELVTVIA